MHHLGADVRQPFRVYRRLTLRLDYFPFARKPAPRANMRQANFGFVAVFSDFKSDLCAIPLGPGRESSPHLQPRTLVLFGYITRPLELAPGI